MKSKWFFVLALIGCAVQAEPGWRSGVLVGEGGKSLYTFDKDTLGKSNCIGGCALQWPPYIAKAREKPATEFGFVAASQQWTFQGKPLYYFVADEKAGDKKGDGAGGVWHLAQTDKSKPEAQLTPSSSY